MKCTNCGNELPEGALFCDACGQKVVQAKLAEEIGTTPSYVNRLIKKNEGIVNKYFIAMLDKLGYDVELTYVRKEQRENESK